jgi:hypothetical protein
MLTGNCQLDDTAVEISWFRGWSHTLYAAFEKYSVEQQNWYQNLLV